MSAPTVSAFDDILQGPFQAFLQCSKTIGGDVATISSLVEDTFKAQRAFLIIASQSKTPAQSDLANLLRPTCDCIQAIQDYRDRNRTSPFFNHLSAMSESIPALGWVTVSPTPGPYVKEMNDAGQFYTNRVLKDWKEKDKNHVDWAKSWVQTLTELQAYVKQHHTTGLVWNAKGGDAKTSSGAAPSGPPPPPMPAGNLFDEATEEDEAAKAKSQLFSELNKGENVTKGLKKVTADMQTHKNPNLRTGPAPFKPAVAPKPGSTVAQPKPADKPAKMALEGKKWILEYQKNASGLVIDQTEMNQVVYMYKCEGSTVQVKGKVNSIVMDSCKKASVVFDNVVSSMEFINCQSVQMQVLGLVPTINIDKTDGCQMYLSKESLQTVIVSAKSSEMNVMVPKPDGDYVEYAVPEQFRTTFSGKGLHTVISEIA
nr:EOG090X08PR [Lepidurus arcticus]